MDVGLLAQAQPYVLLVVDAASRPETAGALTQVLSAALDNQGTPEDQAMWPTVVAATSATVTAMVAVAAAIAGYFRFLRGRTFKPALHLELSGTLVQLAHRSALEIEMHVRNSGQIGVVLDPCFNQSLAVFIADEVVWNDATTHDSGVVLWYDGTAPHRQLPALRDDGLATFEVPPFALSETRRGKPESTGPAPFDDDVRWLERRDTYVLEPGEQEHASVLVPVAAARAYLLQLTVHACSHAGWFGQWRHGRCRSGRATPDSWQTRAIVCRSGPDRRWRRWWS